MITLALLRPFRHVPHLIRAVLILRRGGYNEIWELTFCMESPFPIAFLMGPLYHLVEI